MAINRSDTAIEANNHIQSLDGLRGVAAFMVLFAHAATEINFANNYIGSGSGQTGVMLFFVLSGYLMGYLYIVKPFQPFSFLAKRVARVLPLYYAVVAVAILLALIKKRTGVDVSLFDFERKDILPHLLLLHGKGILWTIPIEVQFYLAFTGIWWLFQRNQSLAWRSDVRDAYSVFFCAIRTLYVSDILHRIFSCRGNVKPVQNRKACICLELFILFYCRLDNSTHAKSLPHSFWRDALDTTSASNSSLA